MARTSGPSRRKFLAASAATGVGAAAVGSLPLLPGSAEATPAARHAHPVVVHVPDPAGAELTVHTGERTGVVTDRDLVARILRAAEEV